MQEDLKYRVFFFWTFLNQVIFCFSGHGEDTCDSFRWNCRHRCWGTTLCLELLWDCPLPKADVLCNTKQNIRLFSWASAEFSILLVWASVMLYANICYVVLYLQAFRRLYEEVGLGWVYAVTKYEPVSSQLQRAKHRIIFFFPFISEGCHSAACFFIF